MRISGLSIAVFNSLVAGRLTKAYFGMKSPIGALFLLLWGLNSLVSNASAANGTPVWTNSFGPGGARAVAVDRNGNVFVTGAFIGSAGNSGYATLAYTSAGAPLWTNYYNGPANGNDAPRGIAVDKNGNVYVTGSIKDGNGIADYATVGYSGNGVPLWTNLYHGPWRDDLARAVAVDENGNVFVTGESEGYPTATDFTSGDFLTIAYSGAGVPLWTNRFTGAGFAGYDEVHGMAVDRSGNVFVVGSSWNGTNNDYATVAYSGAGVPIWTNLFDSGWDDHAQGIAVNADGNVFVTGYISHPGVIIGSEDIVTVAYSGAGVPLWTNYYDGPLHSADYASCIAVDAHGNVYVSGPSVGNFRDYVTLAYSGLGLPLWTNRYTGLGDSGNDDTPYAMAVDANGNVFVTGYSQNNSGGYNYTTVAYLASGVPIWTNSFTGSESAFSYRVPQDIALDSRGNIYITGKSRESNPPFEFVTIKYSALLTMSQAVIENQQFRFQFNADSNISYVVEFSDLLSSSNWMTLTNLSAGSTFTNLSISDAITNSGRIYRVRIQE